MMGSTRPRGSTWEYLVDVGKADAQRCTLCSRRFWVERKLKESCPHCGGELRETVERRRVTKGGYRTQKECQAALAKILTSLEARTFVAPTKVTVKEFLLDEWLPTVKGTLRPTTHASYTMLAKLLGIRRRHRHGGRAALQELQEALLGRAQAQGELPQVRRRTRRDRGAPPRHQGWLCDPEGVSVRPQQGADGGRCSQLRAAHQDHGEGLPARRVAAGHQGHAAPDDLRQLHHARQGAHHPAPGQPAAAEAHAWPHQRPLRSPWRTRPRPWRRSALGLLGAPRPRRPAPRLPRRRALGTAHGQPSGRRRPAQGRAPSTPRRCRCGTPSSSAAFLATLPTIVSSPSGACWP